MTEDTVEAKAELQELVIESGGVSGFVEALPSHTLSDVRSFVMEEFDDDMIPDEGDFYFCINGIRLSAKQEARKKVADLLSRADSIKVSIHSKRKKQKISRDNVIEAVEAPSSVENAPVEEESAVVSSDNEAEVMAIGTGVEETSHISREEDESSKGETPLEEETPKAVINEGTMEGSASANAESCQLMTGKSTETAESIATASTTAGTENMDSARRLLNFNGKFPYDRHSSPRQDEGEQESVATNEVSGAEKSVESNETEPMDMDASPEASPGFGEKESISKEGQSGDVESAESIESPTDSGAQESETGEKGTAKKPSASLKSGSDESEKENIPPQTDDDIVMQDKNEDEPMKEVRALEGNPAKNAELSESSPMDFGSYKETGEEETMEKPSASRKNSSVENENVPPPPPTAAYDDITMVHDENELDEVVEEVQTEDPHKIHDEALKNSCSILNNIKDLLHDNPLFCSEDRRNDWTSEIQESLNKSAPNVTIGVLGNTGVGKSSLLNALLEEASVLPTSGSRGCTAAVVELKFNKDLKSATGQTPVYKGEVEFITLQEWAVELKILIDECSTAEDKTIYARQPQEDAQPDAHGAWSKIDQVYGRGTMERYRKWNAANVYDRLINDQRVKKLLKAPEGSSKPYNSIVVQEGDVNQAQATMLLKGFSKIGTRLRRTKKKWAQKFRSKINDYVYRKGNGNLPQTWPLIRKVVLEGPWVALQTGACLVDLPGVRDANAARAKVAESYLMNCSQIWIVAPIKRAVDDGTAKELLGEQFKRRLLMDGQYGNVAFICTQTDDCEATEIMRDHQDVAVLKPGRWERMTDLRNEIMAIEKEYSDLVQEEEDLKIEHEEAEMSANDAKEELDEAQKDCEEDEDEDAAVDVELLEQMQKDVDEKTEMAGQALIQLKSWQVGHQETMQRMQNNIHKLQRRLKAICATVRNEYSTSCLQEDFRAGLKELCRKPEEEEEDGIQDNTDATPETPLPEDFDMDVYCISANDYLKIDGIKPSSDGPPNTFSKASDTQIPALRAFVHATTAKFRENFTTTFVSSTSDMVDRIKLLAADASNVPGGRTSRRCQALFETEMNKVEAKIKPIAEDFRRKTEVRINSSLSPSLKTGAVKAKSSAMATVTSWGSKSRRRKNDRGPDKNGLHFCTYFATARRDGAYVSPTAGEIDLNQEMCDPMEKEFGSDWQRVLDSSIKVFLRESEAKVMAVASTVDKEVVSGLAKTGINSERLSTMAGTASRSCTNALKASFGAMNKVATDTQRELNRSLLPKIQARMKQGYTNTVHVPGGTGKFMRMKNALEGHASGAVQGMFDESTAELLKEVHRLVNHLSSMIAASSQIIAKTMESVYSVCWDDQSDKAALMDPAMQQKVRECRDSLLPDLNKLRQTHDETMRLVGMEREELDLDVTEVASWEKQNAEKLQAAVDNNMFVDLCDSDEEAIAANVARMPPPPPSSTMRIKADPGAAPATNQNTVTPSLSTADPVATRFSV